MSRKFGQQNESGRVGSFRSRNEQFFSTNRRRLRKVANRSAIETDTRNDRVNLVESPCLLYGTPPSQLSEHPDYSVPPHSNQRLLLRPASHSYSRATRSVRRFGNRTAGVF